MTTRSDMIQALELEYDRTSLTAMANAAIKSAVRHYDTERFYFNEAVKKFVTVADQEIYTFASLSMSDFLFMDFVKTTVSGTHYPLNRRTHQYIEAKQTSDVYTGYPYDYAIHNQGLKFYPIPNASYTCEATYVKSIPVSLSASNSDSTVWTNEAYDLIRDRARAFMDINFFKDDFAIQGQMMFINEGCLSAQEYASLKRLRSRSTQFLSTNSVVPWSG